MTDTPLWSAVVTEDGSTRTVTLTGELDLLGADELRRLLVGQLDGLGVAAVVADLAAVTFLDSAALGALVLAYRHAEDSDRRFTVVAPGHSVRHVLEIGGVYEILAGTA